MFIYNKMNYSTLSNAYNNNLIKKENFLNIGQPPGLYRLGDMIKSSEYRNEYRGYKYHKKHHPNSIATKYMEKTKLSNDFNTLLKIIDDPYYNNYEKPDENKIILHLRVGDVIDKEIASVKHFVYLDKKYTKNVNSYSYVFNLEYYLNIIKKLPKNIKNIDLFYNFHFTSDNTKSKEYIGYIKNLFKSKGYNILEKHSDNFDKDFIYMCNAKHFIQGGGGFSRAIANIVTLKGNNVYFN